MDPPLPSLFDPEHRPVWFFCLTSRDVRLTRRDRGHIQPTGKTIKKTRLGQHLRRR